MRSSGSSSSTAAAARRSRRSSGWASLAAAATVAVTGWASGSAGDARGLGAGERAKATVARIAALGPRPAGSAAERRAGGFVEGRLRSLGYRVVVQPFRLPRGGVSRNVVGWSGRRPLLVVVAHLDGVRAGPAANDNASGVAAMLEVARALRGRSGVLVAALGAEERVETGSSLHLGSVRLLRGISRAGRRRIRAALSLDMVGVGRTLTVRGLESLPNRSARLALARSRALGLGATYRQDTGQSDHAELTRGGLPAAWIQWRWDPCWHSPCDVAERVERRRLAAAIRLASATAEAALAG
jgi:Peptidase family M28